MTLTKPSSSSTAPAKAKKSLPPLLLLPLIIIIGTVRKISFWFGLGWLAPLSILFCCSWFCGCGTWNNRWLGWKNWHWSEMIRWCGVQNQPEKNKDPIFWDMRTSFFLEKGEEEKEFTSATHSVDVQYEQRTSCMLIPAAVASSATMYSSSHSWSRTTLHFFKSALLFFQENMIPAVPWRLGQNFNIFQSTTCILGLLHYMLPVASSARQSAKYTSL